MSGHDRAMDLAERIGKFGPMALKAVAASGAKVGGIVALIVFAPIVFAILLATIPLILAVIFLCWVGGDD